MVVKLSKELARQERLLQLFLSESQVWTSQQLADELGLSKKTVSSYIQQLNIWLKSWDLAIDSDSKGYKLDVPAYVSVHELILEWVKQDVGFQFCSGLFFETIETIESFIEKIYVTSTQFYKKTSEIKKWIEDVGLSFETKPNVQLKGKEEQIRYAYFHFFWSTFKGVEWPFPVSKSEIDELVQKCSQLIGIQVNKLQAEKLAYAVAICLTRVQQGNIVEQTTLNQNSEEDSMYSIIENNYSVLLEKQNIAPQNYRNESLFLTSLVSVIPISLIVESPALMFQRATAPVCKQMTTWVIEELKMVAEIKEEEIPYLLKQLTYLHMEVHYFKPISKEVTIFTLGSPQFKKEKKKIRRNIVHTMIERLKQRGEIEGIPYFNQYPVFLEQNYEALVNRVVDWSIYFKPIKIQVQTDECMYTSNQFSQKIQTIFPDQVTTVSQNYKGSVDIIITTSNVYKTDNCSVLIWKPVPNNRDWENLVDLLDARVMEIN